MVATTQLRLALEAEDERSAKNWNGLDLDLIWIEIGVFKNFKECARSPYNGNHFSSGYMFGSASLQFLRKRGFHCTHESPLDPPLQTNCLFLSLDVQTRNQLSQSTLVNRVKQIRSSRASVEMLDLVDNTLSNLKVSEHYLGMVVWSFKLHLAC